MIKDEYNAVGRELTVAWDNGSITYACGGRKYVKCIGIKVVDSDCSSLVRVYPVTTLNKASNQFTFALPQSADALSELSAVFLKLAKSANGALTLDALAEEVDSSLLVAKSIVKDKESYNEFISLDKDSFMKKYPIVDAIAYNIVKMHYNLSKENS